MHALQDLGESLIALDPAKLAELALPERLVDAITLARGITRHEARRRQLQYVGRLMRDLDPEPIRAALERFAAMPKAERARFAAAERWRDRLLDDGAAATEFIAAFPQVDAQELAQLAGEARAERSSGRPPHKFRALFRFVTQTMRAS